MDFGISDMYGQGEERGATMSHSKGSIMVLGCISVSGVEDLLKLDELEKKTYHQIFTIHATQSGNHPIGNIFSFQKEYDAKNTVKACLDRKTYIIEAVLDHFDRAQEVEQAIF